MARNIVYYNPLILKYKDFSRDVKDVVHRRDEYKCQLCFQTKPMVTHHINYNKQDSHSMNLITLCRQCHERTYIHKNDWLQLFSERMRARFGREYEFYLKDIRIRAKYPGRYKGHYKNGPVKIIKPAK